MKPVPLADLVYRLENEIAKAERRFHASAPFRSVQEKLNQFRFRGVGGFKKELILSKKAGNRLVSVR